MVRKLSACRALRLQGADKGDEACDQPVLRLREKGADHKRDHLKQDGDLPPVELLPPVAVTDDLRHGHSCDKGKNWDKIGERECEVPVGEVHAEQDDVAGLRVCEDPAVGDIGVRIEKAAGEREQQPDHERLGHLPPFFMSHSYLPLVKSWKGRGRRAAQV